METKRRMPETTFAAYLIGPSITVLGIVITFVLGGAQGTAAGAALILGGLMVVCAGMLVHAVVLRDRGRARD